MRLRQLARLAAPTVLVVWACAHEEKAHVAAPQPPPASDPAAIDLPVSPPQYLLADPPPRAQTSAHIALGKGEGIGGIVDGLRVVSSGGVLRAAKDVAEPPLTAVERIPQWLGGGYLFRSPSALYRAETFEGALQPIATLPATVHRISFGPKTMLVRCENGERWVFEMPSGKRAPLEPQGLADVAALRDGRAAAFTDAGSALVTSDGGAHWQDVTAQLRGKPDKVLVHEEALWIVDSAGKAARVEAGGRLASFDRPPAVKPPELRPKDPRWRSDESPVRKALRLGAPLDDSSAIVASDGDIVRVNVVTGEIVSVSPGKLPPDSTCEAVRTTDDIVLVCASKSGSPFVASHVTGDKAPLIEQTFPQAGQFYASDDGSLAFAGPCRRAKVSRSLVCVRSQAGSWQELDLDNVGDAGTFEVSRWVPRPDGTAIGFVVGQAPGLVDARTGELHPWTLDAIPTQVRPALLQGTGGKSHYYGKGGYYYPGGEARLVDRAWTWTGAGLRGWADGGVAVDVQADGSIAVSPFSFERIAHSGSFALARQRDGRVWQTIDRGAHWVEVAAPLLARAAAQSYQNDPRFCSAMGCDLGSWYRLGWLASAPVPLTPPAVASAPAQIDRDAFPLLACKLAGESKLTAIPRGESSPEDLGLGASRVPVSNDARSIEVLRSAFGRLAANPPHGADTSSDGDFSSLRALTWGYVVQENGDTYSVQGPSKDLASFRRNLAFVAPFDPAGAVRKTSFGAYDVVAGGRGLGSGLRMLDVFRDDLTIIGGVAPVTPADAAGPDDLLFFGTGSDKQIVGVARSVQGRVRLVVRVRALDDATPVSAVSLPNDEIAVLEVDGNGASHAFKLGGASAAATDLFDLPAPPGSEYYPANSDALAVGPRGEIAVLRTPSGSEPPSARDPALLITPSGGAPIALAPWSTIEPADSAACKGDASGWRATLHAIGPWLRVSGGEQLRVNEEAPMLARVRWSTARVCLEAVELRLPDHEQRISTAGQARPQRVDYDASFFEATLEPWLVARFVGAPAAARLAIAPGIEQRQPMQCALSK
jgi:hypothetical protein